MGVFHTNDPAFRPVLGLVVVSLSLLGGTAAEAASVVQNVEINELKSPEICASRYDDLELTPRLQKLRPFFQRNGIVGFVNETGGSYFEIDSTEATFQIEFLTSGLFDLTLIRRRGPIDFCDDGVSLFARGIGRHDTLSVGVSSIVFGKGGPKLSFELGMKPTLLRTLEQD